MSKHLLTRNFQIIFGDAGKRIDFTPSLWISPQPPIQPFPWLPPDKLHTRLGTELDMLVFDGRDEFNPNAFAMAAGLVCGGGRLVLLLPEISSNKVSNSRYLQRLCSIAQKPPPPHLSRSNPVSTPEFVLTPGQQQALQDIQHVALGHRRRPLLISADRGRGKSTVLGLAAAALLQQGKQQILVTAPARIAVDGVFQHTGSDPRIRFIAPDELLRKRPVADLLLVDEAAGIPLPLLKQIVHHYSRVVFSTTLHGYEGSGQGFKLRFQQLLDQVAPKWKHRQLHQPVRWSENDPLEHWLNQALLLDAEPAAATPASASSKTNICILDRDKLVQNESLLRQLFGLLVSAHYRTTPNDLMQLLDTPEFMIWGLQEQQQLIGCVLLNREPPLSENQAQAILSGKRRPRGHFLAQALATQCSVPEALKMHGMRILRIAVHPALQSQGLGSRLLQAVIRHARAEHFDYIGSTFGATARLISFWRNNGFTPLRLGYRREARSGEHSVLMLHSLSQLSKNPLNKMHSRFLEQFSLHLSDVYQHMEPQLVSRLLADTARAGLTAEDRFELQQYVRGCRQYHDCQLALHHLAWQEATQNRADPIVILKVLQQRSWKETADTLRLSGRKAVEKRLRAWLSQRL